MLHLALALVFTILLVYFRIMQKEDKYTAIFFGVLSFLSFVAGSLL